jgi:hypothetical protein
MAPEAQIGLCVFIFIVLFVIIAFARQKSENTIQAKDINQTSNPEIISLKKSKMKIAGVIVFIIGILLSVISSLLDTTVYTPTGSVYNIGLIRVALSIFILGVGLMICGVILLVGGKLISAYSKGNSSH